MKGAQPPCGAGGGAPGSADVYGRDRSPLNRPLPNNPSELSVMHNYGKDPLANIEAYDSELNAAVNSVLLNDVITDSSALMVDHVMDQPPSPLSTDSHMETCVETATQTRKRQLRDTHHDNSKAKKSASVQESSTSSNNILHTTSNFVNSASNVADGNLPQNKVSNTNLYSREDEPPFAVYIYSTQGNNARMHFSVLARIVSGVVKSDIVQIKKIGDGKILVEVRTAAAANNIVNNSYWGKNNLKAFIPSFRVLRTGIIKDIDQSLDIDCIKENLTSRVRVISIQRLNRRLHINGKVQYAPSRTLCVKFAGQCLPSEIILFNARYRVDPYIPKARICFSCYRIGHIRKECKSKPRCVFCGMDPHNDEVCPQKDNEPQCINCKDGLDPWHAVNSQRSQGSASHSYAQVSSGVRRVGSLRQGAVNFNGGSATGNGRGDLPPSRLGSTGGNHFGHLIEPNGRPSMTSQNGILFRESPASGQSRSQPLPSSGNGNILEALIQLLHNCVNIFNNGLINSLLNPIISFLNKISTLINSLGINLGNLFSGGSLFTAGSDPRTSSFNDSSAYSSTLLSHGG